MRFLGQRDAEMEEQEGRVNGFGPGPDRRASDWGPIALLDKTKEFFRTCDVEGKGFITRTDMRVSKKGAACGYGCVGGGSFQTHSFSFSTSL